MTSTAMSEGSVPDAPGPRTSIAGVLFDAVDLCTAVSQIGRRAPARNADYVVTPNVDHVVRYQDRKSVV